MKSITNMRQEITAHMNELGKMRAHLTQENREPNSDERKKAHDLLDAIDELERNIKLQERIEGTEERLAEPQREPTRPEPTYTKTYEEQAKKDRFLSSGEFFQAVIRAGSPGGMIDPRLTTRAATGLGETVASDGGFLIQSDIAASIIEPIWQTGAIASRVNRISIGEGKNTLKINGVDETSRATGSRWGGIRAYWEIEAGTKTASKPKFRQIELSLKKLIGLCYATDELLEDANALEGVVTKGFQSEFDFAISDAIINGNGAGRPLGIMNAACLVTQAKETGQSATTIVYENVSKMWSRLFASSRPNAVWLINQDCEPQLHQMGVAVGTGGAPVYVPPGGASDSPYSTLFGRPVIPVEHCQTLGTKGDVLLCDFTDGYVAIDKGGMKQDVSIHVRFIYDESVFRFVYRFDGQPVLASAVTPFKGSNTLSHFVSLATRS